MDSSKIEEIESIIPQMKKKEKEIEWVELSNNCDKVVVSFLLKIMSFIYFLKIPLRFGP